MSGSGEGEGEWKGEEGEDDVALMRAAARGEGAEPLAAFERIVRRHQRGVVNFFHRMGVDTHEAEDLAQEVFLRLYASRGRYRPEAKFTTFLYMVARNVWRDSVRRARCRPASATLSLEKVPGGTGGAEGVCVARRIDVGAALAALSGKLREVVVLGIYQGLTHVEIAKVLDIPVGTVKSRMFLAFRELREALRDSEE